MTAKSILVAEKRPRCSIGCYITALAQLNIVDPMHATVHVRNEIFHCTSTFRDSSESCKNKS